MYVYVVVVGGFSTYCGVYATEKNANKQIEKINNNGYDAYVIKTELIGG